jgi:hypothetical protein
MPCTSGKKVLGGGYSLSVSSTSVRVYASQPTPANDGWQVSLTESISGSPTVTVYAICATVQ